MRTRIVLGIEVIVSLVMVVLYYFVHDHLSPLKASLSMLLVYCLGVVTKTTGERVIRDYLDEMREELGFPKKEDF